MIRLLVVVVVIFLKFLFLLKFLRTVILKELARMHYLWTLQLRRYYRANWNR